MKNEPTFASDIIFTNVLEAAEAAVSQANRQAKFMRTGARNLGNMALDAGGVGQRLEKNVHKKMKLTLRTGKDVRLKALCAYEAANFSLQISYMLNSAAKKIEREVMRYQAAKPGGYIPPMARVWARRPKKKKAPRRKRR